MSKWRDLNRWFGERLRLSRPPVAVAFLAAPPAGVPRFTGSEPSGCSFWRLAADGRVFYTVPSDHFNCAVGSHTHGIPLPPERAEETEKTLGMMFGVGYLRPEEIPAIPQLPATPAAIVYAPLELTPVAPSVVLFACQPATAMLLQEAAIRAGRAAALPALGRPTCMALPAALAQGTTTSLGCIGNRVYTDPGSDELYVVVPGADLEQVAVALETIVQANAQLAEYARGRRRELATE
jgi:uncharacterized protein (DUF169 family)